MVANFSDQQVDLLPQEVLASASTPPENLVESHISHSVMLGLVPEYRETKFRKRHVDVCNIDRIIKHLTDQREFSFVIEVLDVNIRWAKLEASDGCRNPT